MLDDDRIIELIYTLLGSAILGLIGFVWKISHRVTVLQNRMEAMEKGTRQDVAAIRRDIETLMSHVDKNREWTTNRMMSIAKEMKP